MQKTLLLLVVVAFIPRTAAAQGSRSAVVVWHSIGNNQDGSGSGVFGQRYNQIVAPVE